MTVEGVLQTPDGLWRVEVVRRDSIAAVERILADAGVDRATLIDPTDLPTTNDSDAGAA
ncbi:hypothetical protein [Nucisporomicrobium flavum]|uniref:hypothetical protein n=1 Tax=Nucisporomicrobium flavum TaxID=2785915 RepID=UPI0018F2840F|nr:hypothetical protein [Nucisporomicrobium flavum]